MIFLSRLLCLLMTLGPWRGGLTFSHEAQAQTTCPPGQSYGQALNRCLLTALVIESNRRVEECRKITNETSRKDCYTNNVNELLAAELNSKKEECNKLTDNKEKRQCLKEIRERDDLLLKSTNKKGGASLGGIISSAATITVPLLILIKIMANHKVKTCKPPSLLLLYAGGAALFTGEVVSSIQHGANLKKMNEARKAFSVTENTGNADDNKAKATEAQSQAFELLAQNEDSIAQVAMTKTITYGIASGLFSAGVIAATIEIFQYQRAISTADPITAQSLTCVPQASTEDTNSNQSVNLNEFMHLDMKKKALKNLENAKSFPEMIELLAEINSLEFENYSRSAYYHDHSLFEELPKSSFSQELAKTVSDVLISQANAVGNGGVQNGSPETEPNQTSVTTTSPNVNSNSSQSPKATAEVEIEAQAKEVTKVEGFFNQSIYLPSGRAVINGLLGTWMGIMTGHMAKVQKISKSRAEMLRSMRDEFDTQGGLATCSSEDRDDPGKPQCYCFTYDNKKNPARSNSKICDNSRAHLKYDIQGLGNAPKVCMDMTYGVDTSCSCRNRKGSDGKNTCLKVGSNFNFQGMNPGTFKMIGAVAGPANDLFNGNASVGNFNSGSIGTNAARIKAVADQLIAKNNSISQGAKSLENSLLGITRGVSLPGGDLAERPSLSGMSPKEAAAALDKELAQNNDIEVQTAGAGGPSAPAKAPLESQPEFGLTQDQFEAQQGEIAEVMKKDLDMGNSDIHSGPSTNLFEVLSNRYQRSGLRRLFDEEGKVMPDEPSTSEISP